ncbi:MAG: enoyl-CoA hydratase/isomerase family protein [Rhodospirillaceae bacterium]
MAKKPTAAKAGKASAEPKKAAAAGPKTAAAAAPAPAPAAAEGKYECIIAAKVGNALEITLNRPDRMNAINEQMAGEIIDALLSVELDRDVLAVILQGNERAFCAGADLSGFSDRPEDRYDNYRARFNVRKNRQLFKFISGYTKPVISAVEGYCLGGGLELAMFGDIIVASETAQFGLPEARHSLIPGAGGTQNLPRLIGKALAKELMWTTRRISAQEAKEFRMVNHVVPKGGAAGKAREIVAAMSKNGPLAIMMIKQAIDRGVDMTLAQGFLQEADLAYLLTFTEDRAEGLRAFAEKREPKFKGQ